jgi:ribosomal protein S18 acetylase RimI-like enzyme
VQGIPEWELLLVGWEGRPKLISAMTSQLPANVAIRHEFKPGDIDYLTHLHGTLYAKDCGWDESFEAYVAVPLSEFSKSQKDREKIWLVEKDAAIAGSIAIVQASVDVAQLRWFLLHPDLRGRGIGRHLMEEALNFCREKDYHSVYLWTESRLEAAADLYRSVGFKVTEEKTHELWGMIVTEQRYDLQLE